MASDLTPQPGDGWDRDGERRYVRGVLHVVGGKYKVHWKSHKSRPTWGDAWQEWARGARLIERDGKKVEGGK